MGAFRFYNYAKTFYKTKKNTNKKNQREFLRKYVQS